MSRFTVAKWWKPIVVKHLLNEHTPFDNRLVTEQIVHHTDWLNHVKGVNISAGDPITEPEPGIIEVSYTNPEDEEWWARENTETEGVKIISSRIEFNASKCPTPDKFAGLLFHELQHSFGIYHRNGVYSVMNDDPYMNFTYQGTCKFEDFRTLDDRFQGAPIKHFPAVYDYGNLQEKCIFNIPSIRYLDRDVQMTLSGAKENDEWFLTAELIEDVPFERSVCTIENGTWTIPVRYMQHSFTITAEQVSDNPLKLRVISVNQD